MPHVYSLRLFAFRETQHLFPGDDAVHYNQCERKERYLYRKECDSLESTIQKNIPTILCSAQYELGWRWARAEIHIHLLLCNNPKYE